MGKATKKLKKLAIGAAVAGAAGYIAGILTAPKSGKQTRAELKDAVDDGISEVEKQLKGVHKELDHFVGEAKDKGGDMSGKAQKELDKLVGVAKDSKDKLSELAKLAKKGDASDKDLKKAIKDARHAIDHIKDFLQK
ncbi:MAG: hypothetical protein JWN38_407 [Candidatus Saccharibacteria bacterium]|nr:hypothetical protein [Candidatus Saccharibacteria bacterium]